MRHNTQDEELWGILLSGSSVEIQNGVSDITEQQHNCYVCMDMCVYRVFTVILLSDYGNQ